MRGTAVRPTGVERRLGPDELIVSKTDRRGIITYANDAFLRISAYPEEDLLGQPHNVVRHPDMPRAVFKLLWDTISAGEEIFAYVVNLAGDGAHYWVLAHVTPSFDGAGQIVGYHSNRRAPDPAALDVIRPLYARLCDEERRHPGGQQATAASAAMLAGILAERGQTYDEFIWSITPAMVLR
jgi:PAS domain S-box-containing protein